MRVRLFTVCYLILFFPFMSVTTGQVHPLHIASPVMEEVLMKNRIAEIVALKYDKSNKRTDTSAVYRVNEKGRIVFYVYDHLLKDRTVRIIKKIIPDQEMPVETMITGELMSGDSIKMYEKKIHYYTQFAEVYRTVETSYYGNEIIEDYEMDTLDPAKTRKTILTLNGGDTLRIIAYDKNGKRDTYSLREKKNGVWDYDEKQITLYEEGRFSRFTRLVNGRTVDDYSPDTVLYNKKDVDERNFNPLPYTNQDRTDSTYVPRNDPGIIPPAGQFHGSKLLKVEYHVPYEKDKPVSIKLFYPNGLLYLHDNTNEKFLTYYVYSGKRSH